jgi:hypothetical protein
MKQLMATRRRGRARGRERYRISPALDGPLIPARARELRDFRLNVRPYVSRAVVAGIENDRGTPLARAEDVEAASTDVDGAAYLWKESSIPTLSDLLVGRADNNGDEKCCKKILQRANYQRGPGQNCMIATGMIMTTIQNKT